MMHKTEDILLSFAPISLQQMEHVSLMNRVDTKFIGSLKHMHHIINDLPKDYRILEIDNNRIFPYKTEYFDTKMYNMYTAHQNGKLNRYKIRKREYLKMEQQYLEVKFKNNKGKTIKQRIKRNKTTDIFSTSERDFLKNHSPYNSNDLELKLKNQFNRITFVGEKERLTIDYNLKFWNESDLQFFLPEIFVIELKQHKYNPNSTVQTILKKHNLQPQSFSKYCIGTASLNQNIKANLLKQTMKNINKLKTELNN